MSPRGGAASASGARSCAATPAHAFPPAGGFGTGVQDAHNLAWRLAVATRFHREEKMVTATTCSGSYGSLLDAYASERRPVAVGNARERGYFHRVLEIPKALGLHPGLADAIVGVRRRREPRVRGRIRRRAALGAGLSLGRAVRRTPRGDNAGRYRRGAVAALCAVAGKTLGLQHPERAWGSRTERGGWEKWGENGARKNLARFSGAAGIVGAAAALLAPGTLAVGASPPPSSPWFTAAARGAEGRSGGGR